MKTTMTCRTFTNVLLAAAVSCSSAVSASAQPIDAKSLMATVQTLASPAFEGRRAGTPGGARARAWVAERFKAIGLEPLESGTNVVGLCRGRGRATEAMVVSAHFDHEGVRDGQLYPGADDNASGVAVLLAIAEQCKRTPFVHDTVFASFDAEEQGLQGSKAFVAKPPIDKARIALNVNLDMVARGDTGELYAAGTYHWPSVRAPLAGVARRSQIKLRFGHDRPEDGNDDWTNQSDHGSFHAAGIPFVYFGVEDHPDYHKPTDTPEKIDPTFFRAAAETILDAVKTLDQALPAVAGDRVKR
jgi:Zn-dependent M28 family amino/carboxypeptidase